MASSSAWRVLLIPGALALGGCGPIVSTSMIMDAEAKLAAAKAAEAERYAPYEYTAAEEYLHKAHEEVGYADYGPAIDYAYKAAEAAERGTKRASDEKAKFLDAPPDAPQAPAADGTAPKAPVTIKRIDVKTPQPEQP
jgi:hypothetical protein